MLKFIFMVLLHISLSSNAGAEVHETDSADATTPQRQHSSTPRSLIHLRLDQEPQDQIRQPHYFEKIELENAQKQRAKTFHSVAQSFSPYPNLTSSTLGQPQGHPNLSLSQNPHLNDSAYLYPAYQRPTASQLIVW